MPSLDMQQTCSWEANSCPAHQIPEMYPFNASELTPCKAGSDKPGQCCQTDILLHMIIYLCMCVKDMWTNGKSIFPYETWEMG
jgi:hypothetical protein